MASVKLSPVQVVARSDFSLAWPDFWAISSQVKPRAVMAGTSASPILEPSDGSASSSPIRLPISPVKVVQRASGAYR